MNYAMCFYNGCNIHVPSLKNVFLSDIYPKTKMCQMIQKMFFEKGTRGGDLIIKRFRENPRSDFFHRGAEIGRINNAFFHTFPTFVHTNVGIYTPNKKEKIEIEKAVAIRSASAIMQNVINTMLPKMAPAAIFAFNSENPKMGIILIHQDTLEQWKNHSILNVIEVVDA